MGWGGPSFIQSRLKCLSLKHSCWDNKQYTVAPLAHQEASTSIDFFVSRFIIFQRTKQRTKFCFFELGNSHQERKLLSLKQFNKGQSLELAALEHVVSGLVSPICFFLA